MVSSSSRAGFVGRDSRLSRIVERAAELNQVLDIVRRAAPPELAPYLQGAAWSGTTLLIAVSSGAAAGRLRPATPALLDALRDAGWNATAIQLKVQVAMQRENIKQTKRLAFPPAALEAFSRLSETLDDADLRGAVANLLHHQSDTKK